MTKAERQKQRRALALLKKSIVQGALGKHFYKASGDAFDEALALGLPVDQPIALRGFTRSEDGKSVVRVGGKVEAQIIIRDGLVRDGAPVNSGYTNARFARFRVEPFRGPKPTSRAQKKTAPNETMPAPTAEAGV